MSPSFPGRSEAFARVDIAATVPMPYPCDAELRSLIEFVSQGISQAKVPSISLGISVSGRTILCESFGMADLAKGIPATPDTPYSVASITKPMTGTLLAILSGRGKISIEAPVNQYLGSEKLRAFEGDSDAATIACIANHTSGLPMYFQFFFEGEGGHPPGYEETLRRYGSLMRPPGERYVYSNIGYGILGYLIERQSDKPLAQSFSDDLFSPLGMTGSFLSPTNRQKEMYAVRYDRDLNPLPHFVTDHPAASEAYSSVIDLLKFGESHVGKTDSPVLSRDQIRVMQLPRNVEPIEKGYGLGWGLATTKQGERYIAHSGGMDGVSTRLGILPDREIVFTVLCNHASQFVTQVTDKIWEILGIHLPVEEIVNGTTTVSPEFRGSWRGTIGTYEREIPIGLDFEPNFPSVVTINGREALSDLQFDKSIVRGSADGQIQTSDATRTPHKVMLDLTHRGDRLSGFITARSIEGARIGHAIAYPAQLVRA